MNLTVMRHELRKVVFSVRGGLVLALLALIAAYAVSSGNSWTAQRTEAIADFLKQTEQQRAEWRTQLVAFEEGSGEVGVFDARPMDVRIPAVLPPGPLGHFAVGQGALQPHLAAVRPWRNATSVFEKHQFDNPTTLRHGRFDLAFVVIVLLPLLLIAMTYDVVAEDRSQGTLQMTLAQPITLSSVVWTRMLTRSLPLWLLTTGVILLAGLGGSSAPEELRLGRTLVWALCASGYFAFWFAVVAWVVSWRGSAERCVATLVALWGVLVLALPALVSTVAASVFPAPSRLGYLSEVRAAEAEAARETTELTENFIMAHPELSVSEEAVPAYYRAALLASRLAERKTAATTA